MQDSGELQQTLIILKKEFDQALLEGKCFEEVKPIHARIKAIEHEISGNGIKYVFSPPTPLTGFFS